MPSRVVSVQAAAGTWTPYALSIRNFATLRYAQEFYETARKAGSPMVRAYLLGHAIELFLKTYLLANGMKPSQLKRKPYSHDLEHLLSEALSRGLGRHIHISPRARQSLHELAMVYPEQLRYFSLSYLFVSPAIPPLASPFRTARSLNEYLSVHIRVEA